MCIAISLQVVFPVAQIGIVRHVNRLQENAFVANDTMQSWELGVWAGRAHPERAKPYTPAGVWGSPLLHCDEHNWMPQQCSVEEDDTIEILRCELDGGLYLQTKSHCEQCSISRFLLL